MSARFLGEQFSGLKFKNTPSNPDPQWADEVNRTAHTTVPVHQLLAETTPGDLRDGEPEADLWKRKLDESIEKDLDVSISEEGIHSPIGVYFHPNGDLELMNGHHRAITAATLNPDEKVPVAVMKWRWDRKKWGDRW